MFKFLVLASVLLVFGCRSTSELADLESTPRMPTRSVFNVKGDVASEIFNQAKTSNDFTASSDSTVYTSTGNIAISCNSNSKICNAVKLGSFGSGQPAMPFMVLRGDVAVQFYASFNVNASAGVKRYPSSSDSTVKSSQFICQHNQSESGTANSGFHCWMD